MYSKNQVTETYISVSHASELKLLYGPVLDANQLEFANQMLDFYINFVNDLNPGGVFSHPWQSYGYIQHLLTYIQSRGLNTLLRIKW